MLINDSHALTKSYQGEIGKWQSKQYDNKGVISITDKYLPEFQRLVKSSSFAACHSKIFASKGLVHKITSI
jgi:hypothetical protein